MLMRDSRHVSSETSCLICVGVGRSDGRHKANSSLHAITNVPTIFDNSTVMMGIDKGIEEAHHHDTTLKASQEHSGDQFV